MEAPASALSIRTFPQHTNMFVLPSGSFVTTSLVGGPKGEQFNDLNLVSMEGMLNLCQNFPIILKLTLLCCRQRNARSQQTHHSDQDWLWLGRMYPLRIAQQSGSLDTRRKVDGIEMTYQLKDCPEPTRKVLHGSPPERHGNHTINLEGRHFTVHLLSDWD